MKKKLLLCLLALVMLYNIALPASAAHPVPDLSRNGSITFEMTKNDKPLKNGKLRLCMVGEIVDDDGNFIFGLIDALKDTGVDLQDPTDPDVAEKLLKYVNDRKLTAQTADIADGKAKFSDLPVGLYLIWQEKSDATSGYYPINPFLISIPRFLDGVYIHDIIAKPKVPLVPKPYEPPPPPPPPNIPQTGQLNWPVPVMAVGGCALFAVGLFLCRSRKKTEDAEA